MTSQSGRKERRVRFQTPLDTIQPTICRADYTPDELKTCFYNTKELREIDVANEFIVKTMQSDSGRVRNSDSRWFCTRGLDDYVLPHRLQQRKERLQDKWDDVFYEQQEQRCQGRNDQHRIARACQYSSTYPSERIALGQGLMDEFDAFSIHDLDMMKAYNIKYDEKRMKPSKSSTFPSRSPDPVSFSSSRSKMTYPEETKTMSVSAMDSKLSSWSRNNRRLKIPTMIFQM